MLSMAFLSLKKLIPPEIHEEQVCGIDEVGSGPWAGPIVACALMFPKSIQLPGLKDSKQLSEQQREEFYKILHEQAAYGIGVAEVEEVDSMGLLKANNTAFQRALKQLAEKGYTPSFLLVDGRDKLSLPHPHKTVIKGDEKIRIVACASIVAKVYRDRLMKELAKKYPEYGFENHKGYGTDQHQQALRKHGACTIHRKSFAPVHNLLQLTIE